MFVVLSKSDSLFRSYFDKEYGAIKKCESNSDLFYVTAKIIGREGDNVTYGWNTNGIISGIKKSNLLKYG
jgi:glutathionylspermidine synthase